MKSGKPLRLLFGLLSPRQRWRFYAEATLIFFLAGGIVMFGLNFLTLLVLRAQFGSIGFAMTVVPGLFMFFWVTLVGAVVNRRMVHRGFPGGVIPPICLRCGYSLAGLADDQGWRVCPECNRKSPDRIRIGFARFMGVIFWPVVRPRTD